MLPAERKYWRLLAGYSMLLPTGGVAFILMATIWFLNPDLPNTAKAISLFSLFALASVFVLLSPLALIAAIRAKSQTGRILAAFPLTYLLATPLAMYLGTTGNERLWIAIYLSYVGATMLISLTVSVQMFVEARKKLKQPAVHRLGCQAAHEADPRAFGSHDSNSHEQNSPAPDQCELASREGVNQTRNIIRVNTDECALSPVASKSESESRVKLREAEHAKPAH